jgi:hypothetical protein
MTTLISRHGTTLNVIPGRTVIHYRDGYIMDDIQTFPSQFDAKRCAEQKNAIARTLPLPHLHRFSVVSS